MRCDSLFFAVSILLCSTLLILSCQCGWAQANILAVDSSGKLAYQPGALICLLDVDFGLKLNSTDFGSILSTAFADCVVSLAKRQTLARQAVLVVPAGHYYLTTKIVLSGGVNWLLHFNGSMILYTDSVAGYAFIIENAQQFVLSGDSNKSLNASRRGSLNGQAWLYAPQALNTRLLKIESSNNVTVGRLNFIMSPSYHFVISGVTHMEVFEVLINGPTGYGTTDGMDVSGSNIFIHDVQVSDGDECVTIKDPASNVLVENVLCMGSSGCSFGSFGQAAFSNASGNVAISNITYRNIYMQGGYGWGIKACTTNNGLIENITLQNLILDSSLEPININYYWSCSNLPQGLEPGAGNLTVRNVKMENVTGSQSTQGHYSQSKAAVNILCADSSHGPKYPTCYSFSISNFAMWPSNSLITQIWVDCQNVLGTGICLNSTSFAARQQYFAVTPGKVPAPTWGLIQYPLTTYPTPTAAPA